MQTGQSSPPKAQTVLPVHREQQDRRDLRALRAHRDRKAQSVFKVLQEQRARKGRRDLPEHKDLRGRREYKEHQARTARALFFAAHGMLLTTILQTRL